MPRKPQSELDVFTIAYMTCALWSSNDERDETGGDPLDRNYCIADIDDDTYASMIDDCERFQRENADILAEAYQQHFHHSPDSSPDDQAGQDFWLTRNGHGCGFWEESDWPVNGDKLDKAAQAFGEVFLAVSDDGKIYSIG